MQINSINSQQSNFNKKTLNSRPVLTSQNNVSFQGVNKLDPRNLRRLDKFILREISHASGALNCESEKVENAMKKASTPQKVLFALLTENYNCSNFARPAAQKEDSNLVFSLVEKIKFPTKSHFEFAASQRFGVTRIAEAMDSLDFNARKIKKFHNISRDLRKRGNASADEVMSLLHSENKSEYLSNYSSYKYYFRRHIKEKDCVSNLDKMLKNRTYDAVKEKKLYDLEEKLRNSTMGKVVDVKLLAPYSSNESNALLELFNEKLSPTLLKDKEGYKESFAKIYSTTTKDNIEARKAYMNTYMYSNGAHEYNKNEIKNITTLFIKMDKDPAVMDFVQKISEPKTNTIGAGGFLKIVNNIPSEKYNLYSNNIRDIISSRIKNPVDKAIRFCSMQPDTVLGKAVKGVKKYLTSFVSKPVSERQKSVRNFKRQRSGYGNAIDVAESEKPAVIDVIKSEEANKKQSYLPAIIYRNPKIDLSRPVYTAPVLPKLADMVGGNNRIKFNIPVPMVTKPFEKKVDTVKRSGIFVNRSVKQPSAQKLQVISDVNNLIEKKLGKNTLADQSKSYERGATKMRLNMLPEIFDSIKETRAQKRVAGTFNKHKSESNADAVTLYNMINGKNKRLVNYMLKVRNQDGSRVYSVKDIISTVGESEKSIRMSKLRGNPISSTDTKALYANMLNEHIAQRGKLPRAKKKNY